jgi:putative ABC transport system permease protein
VNWETATSGYFDAMGLPLREGRLFNDRDTATSPAVVVISESLARYLSRDGDGRVLGRKLITLDGPKDSSGQPVWQTVVGVVKDARYRELTRARFDIYLPHAQADAPLRQLVVRAAAGGVADSANEPATLTAGAGGGAGDTLALVAPVREIVRAIDPSTTIDGIVLLEDVVARARASWTFNALVFTLFGALSLVLVAAGMFGVLAYSVATRTREIGIRLALGAQRHNVLRTLLLEGAAITAAGLIAGLTIALSSAHLLDALLFDIAPRDTTTFTIAAALVCLITLLAMWIPARAALAVSPLVALRRD